MDTLFFAASKIIWTLIRPETWLVIGLALTCLGLFLGRRRLAGWSGGLTLSYALVLAILPVGDWALRPLELRYPIPAPPARVDGILVLGGAEDGLWTAQGRQVRFNEGGERFTEALRLARLYPEAKLVFSGGSGALGNLGALAVAPENTTAMVFFLEQGIAPERLILETASRNTAENAAFSLKMLDPRPDQTWLLVTSAFHMERSMRTFAAAGWVTAGAGTEGGLLAWPTDFRSRPFPWAGLGWNLAYNLRQLDVATKEYVGLVAYALTGR
ncbi:YdcF family protein [Xinfangfangia sp. D13-10-4-6]|uniref:YdcF family protein n=1 Tax=Pseudogemmobacter hezensis TaxID=2737662 RepID=UPI001551AC82|nr:YdcF family protein [Pseudogemmobacter hezensis]NPD13942.1 YdcF family protein [Pseudogemmobacter hezensis]